MARTPEILVDTGAFYALVDRADANHAAAVGFLRAIDRPLMTTNFILDEAITLIRCRLSHATAVRFARPIREGRGLTVVPVTAEDEDAAWSIFERYDDKEWSFTDCTSFAVMTRPGLEEAFAFDGDFEQYGLRSVPPRR